MLTGNDRAANDRRMVHREQTLAQNFLNSEKANNPSYDKSMNEINAMLNGGASQFATGRTDPAFAGALRETRRELGRPI